MGLTDGVGRFRLYSYGPVFLGEGKTRRGEEWGVCGSERVIRNEE